MRAFLKIDAIDKSPFDVAGLDTDITTEEILEFVRESRSEKGD